MKSYFTFLKSFPILFFLLFAFAQHSYAQDCDPNLAEPTAGCPEAPIVCELEGFCSTMPTINNSGGPVCGGQFFLHNTHWFSFIATATTVLVEIEPSNCITVSGGTGLQGAITTSCPTGFPYPTIGNCQAACTSNTFTLGIGGNFVIGQQYWIMLDGCSGSICDYEITSAQGLTLPALIDPTVITGPFEVCAGETATFTVDDPTFATTFYWVVDGVQTQSTGRTLSYQIPPGTPDGTFQVCLTDAENACYALVEDNGYVPNSVCFEVEVVNLDPTVLPQVDICVENAPYTRDGFTFFPPTSLAEYNLTSNRGCDSMIRFDINWIEFDPDDQILVTCEGEFPVFIPNFGNVFAPGGYLVDYNDLTYNCDSSYNVQVNEIIFDFDVRLDRFNLECPDENIPIDASQTVVRLLPSGDVIFNVDYEWFLDGVPIGTGVFMTAFQGGTYTFRVTANYDGVICSSEYEFEIIENFDIPEAPDMGPALSGCIGNIMEINILNWDFSNPPEIRLFPGTCFTIISQNGPTIIIELDEACNDVLCVQLNKPGCQLLASDGCVNIAIADQLNPGLVGVDNFCEGGNTTLSGGAGFLSYTWAPGGQTTTSIFVDSPGLYSLVVEDANGCTGEQSIDVIENPEPPVNFSGSTAFCIDGSTTITVSQDNYVTYQWSHGPAGRVVVLDTEGTYTVTVTDGNGCTGSSSIVVVQRDELEPQIGGDFAFCAGDDTVLDGGGGFAIYEWTGPQSGDQRDLTVNLPGTYVLRVEDANGCSGTSSVVVVEDANPEPQIDRVKDAICPGESLDLAVDLMGIQYLWEDNSTSRTRTVNAAGVYEVTVTDGNGCTGEVSVQIDVLTPPSPVIAGEDYFCAGLSALIGVGNIYSGYSWSPGGGSGNELVVNQAGTYRLVVTDVDGCTGEASFDVDERPNPVPVISGDAEFCAGGSTVLTVGQTYDRYTWSGPVSGTNPSLDVSQNGVYQVEVEDGFGCIGSGTFQVTVHPNPTPQIGGSTQYCVGLSTTLRGGNYVSWRWELAGGSIVTTQDIVVNTPGTYRLTVTDVNGCTGTSSVSVIEDDELSITLDGDIAFCTGLTARVFVNGTFVDYNWAGPMAGLPNAAEIIVNVPGTYNVTVTDADGCTGRSSFTVIENPNPVPDISGPNSFCTGRSATLDAGAGYTAYIWSTGAVTRTVSVTSTGTYTVTVTDGNGCIGADAIFIEELESLQPGFEGDPFFCAGASTQITVQSGYTRYTWLDDNSTNPQRTFSAPGTYVVEVEDADGCTGTGAIVVVENPLPMADAGADQELTCRDNELTIGGSGTSMGNFSYSWTEIEQGVSVSGTMRTLLVTEPGLYVLRVVNNTTGCESEDMVRVSINDDVIRSAEIEALDPRCFNETNGIIRVVSIDGGVGPFVYRINGGDMAQGVQGNLSPGQYRIYIEDSNGCTYEEVFILSNPSQVTVDAGPDILLEYGDATTIIPVTNIPESSIRNIRWEEGDLVLCDGCPTLDLVVQPELASTYRITIEDEFGCTATDLMRINLKRSRNVFIPSAFTPTANGINDRFTVYTGRDVINIKSLKVFDRWGNALYEAEDIPPNDESYGWDGTFQGKEMDPAVFLYSAEVEFIDGEIFQYFGDVALIK